MASFSKFISSFDPDSNTKGKQFEHFVKWFLKNDQNFFEIDLKNGKFLSVDQSIAD